MPRLLLILAFATRASAATVEYNRDVRPILSDKCFTCHGPDVAAKKVPFRLDRESFAKADLGNGRHAIVEGDANASELIHRITSANKAQRMPPAYSGLQLSDPEIDTLRQWIGQGAKWEQHWSFIPPKRPDPPAVRNESWARNPIDRFILARLEREVLTPAPEAARATLLRRVSLDLTGLPPSPAELDALLADQSTHAYEKAVDRLLASPHFGERMAARWLDAARYADTNGYQYDGERNMWRWRDWVIDAFNSNKPYDRFVTEQLAGDLLPHAKPDQIIATGFNRNHRINTEDGIVPEEYYVEQIVDRVETTSTVFLGLTLGCARCHNHKYDPFTQKEFYSLYAFFDSVPELGRGMKYGNTPPLMPAPTAEQLAKLREYDARIPKQMTWLASTGLVYELAALTLDGTNPVTDRADTTAFEITDPFSIAAWVRSTNADGSIASRMADNPRGKGYGLHVDHGHLHANLTSIWVDDAIRVVTEETIAPGELHHVAMTYDGSRLASGVKIFIDGKPARLKIEKDTLYRPFNNAGKKTNEPLRIGAGWGPEHRLLGDLKDVRVYARELDPQEIAAFADPQSPYALRRRSLENDAEARRISELALDRDRYFRSLPTVMVMRDDPHPHDTFLLVRGAYDKPGEKVSRGVPAVLPPLPTGASLDRLGLARWLVAPNHPLTARVAVNRFWQLLFGTGIVKTVEDFGVQGEWPSHPELLDWLATEFIRSGWDTKALLRTIVTSAAYRQSSVAPATLLQRDPENRLIARGPRFRLPAETMRDQALFAAGLLTDRIGGPSMKPYQPAGLWKETSMQDMDYIQSHGPDLYRRSLYIFWKRTIAPPMMVNFDAANRETCVVRDSRTNTPLQALDLMNDVTFLEAARMIGQRMIREGGADAASRLRYGFRLVTSRDPSPRELEVLRGDLAWHADYFASKPEAAQEILRQGEAPADASIAPQQLAAYASVASLLLNLDETVTKP